MKKYKEAKIKAECVEQVCEYIDEQIQYLNDDLESCVNRSKEEPEEIYYQNRIEEIYTRIEYMNALIEKLVK